MSFVPSLAFSQAGGAAPFTVQLAPDQAVRIYSIVAEWEGVGASGSFYACLSLRSQDGVLVSRTRPEQIFAAGDTGVVTYAPFLHSPVAAPAVATIIPFVRTNGGNNRVTIVTESPGQDPVDISTPTANVVLSPVASPDGTMVAWEQAGNLRVVNSDGTGEALIKDAAALGKSINGLDWAKDSSHILYGLSDGGAAAAGYDLRTILPDGTGDTQLYTDAANRVGLPLYSYDGTKIAFWAYAAGPNRSLKTMNADTSNVQTAATPPGVGVLGDVQDFAWAKASYRLAYISAANTASVVNFDGTGLTALSGTIIDVIRECWLPDDSAIFYSSTVSLVDLRKSFSDGSGNALVLSDAGHTHGRMILARSTRAYRDGVTAAGRRFVESVKIDGTDFRFEEAPTFADAYSMF